MATLLGYRVQYIYVLDFHLNVKIHSGRVMLYNSNNATKSSVPSIYCTYIYANSSTMQSVLFYICNNYCYITPHLLVMTQTADD